MHQLSIVRPTLPKSERCKNRSTTENAGGTAVESMLIQVRAFIKKQISQQFNFRMSMGFKEILKNHQHQKKDCLC